jgi:MSHA pilin protein MshA
MQSKGFTLIELVVVIVILGILAVTAAPKFINLQADAKTATLQSIQASLESAAALVYSKAIVKGNQNESASNSNTVNIGDGGGLNSDGELLVAFGYPVGVDDELQRLLDLDAQYDYETLGTASDTVAIYFTDNGKPTSINDDCIVYYISSTAPRLKPEITVNDCT